MIQTVLVVCTGNICRSPMVEGRLRQLLKSEAATEIGGLKVHSRGLAALTGRPAVKEAVELMRSKGVDISSHRARQIDMRCIQEADLVLVMEENQRKFLHKYAPSSCGKVFTLGQFDGIDIPDPYMQDAETFKHVYSLMNRYVAKWFYNYLQGDAITRRSNYTREKK